MWRNKRVGVLASDIILVIAMAVLLPTQASAWFPLSFGGHMSCTKGIQSSKGFQNISCDKNLHRLKGLKRSKDSCAKGSHGDRWQQRHDDSHDKNDCANALSYCGHANNCKCDRNDDSGCDEKYQWRHRYGQNCNNACRADQDSTKGDRWRHRHRGHNNCSVDCNQTACTIPDYDDNMTGIVRGNVYEDSNHNGLKDSNETGIAGIAVTIEDAESNTFVVHTDENGLYMQAGVAEGEAIVTVDALTLPSGAELSAGENPSLVTVVLAKQCDEDADADMNCSIDNHCGMLGHHCRYGGNACTAGVFQERHNTCREGRRDRYRGGDCTAVISSGSHCKTQKRHRDRHGGEQCIIDTSEGNSRLCDNPRHGHRHDTFHCRTKNPVDHYGISCDRKRCGHRQGQKQHKNHCRVTEPRGHNTAGENRYRHGYGKCHKARGNCGTSHECNCGYTECTIVYSDAGNDGYTFEADPDQKLTGSIEGLVFVDIDRDGTFNSGDMPLSGITVVILDGNAKVVGSATTNGDGKYLVSAIPVGTATVDIDESSLPDDVETSISVGTDPTIVEVLVNQTVWEESNGYEEVPMTP